MLQRNAVTADAVTAPSCAVRSPPRPDPIIHFSAAAESRYQQSSILVAGHQEELAPQWEN